MYVCDCQVCKVFNVLLNSPPCFKVQLSSSVSGFKSDVTVPVDDNEESLARSDSYENFHKALQSVDGTLIFLSFSVDLHCFVFSAF